MGLGFHDSSEDNYTGAYSYDSPELRSYNPDHDIELIFDAKLSNLDVNLINNIRHEINKAFEKDDRRGSMSITVEHVMIGIQDNIKSDLDKLLNKKRDIKSKEPSRTEYKWGQLKNQRDSEAIKEMLNENKNIFKYIDSVVLKRNEEIITEEDILPKLKELELFARSDWCSGKFFDCPVCPNYLSFHEPKSANAHIENEEHKEEARKIKEKIEKKENRLKTVRRPLENR